MSAVDYSIQLDLTPTKEDDAFIRQSLQNFNNDAIGPSEKQYSVFARNAAGNLIGGALVEIDQTSAFVDILWVHDDHRNKGIGRALLNEAEKEAAKSPKCRWMKLDTFSFQAPEFYLKCGYEVYGRVENFIGDDAKIFFRKKVR